MRMIDADELKKQFLSEEPYGPEEIRGIIDNAPTTKVSGLPRVHYDRGFIAGYEKAIAERPQGEWKVNNYGEHICPICGHYALYDECQDNDYYEVQSNFCPECGADLRGKENETDN